MPRGDLVARGSMLSMSGGPKKNDRSGVDYTSGGYLPVDTRYISANTITPNTYVVKNSYCENAIENKLR